MRGKSHVAMNVVTAGAVADTLFVMSNNEINSWSYNISESLKNFLLDTGDMPMPVFLIVSILLYVFGALLPDIDYPYSTLGKIIHLPIEHRTWTHAVWIPAMLCIAGIFVRPLFYLGLGMFLHDFWDSLSSSGINWFYPIKNKHHVTLYGTSGLSEYFLVFIVLVLFVFYTLGCLQHVYHFVNVSF